MNKSTNEPHAEPDINGLDDENSRDSFDYLRERELSRLYPTLDAQLDRKAWETAVLKKLRDPSTLTEEDHKTLANGRENLAFDDRQLFEWNARERLLRETRASQSGKRYHLNPSRAYVDKGGTEEHLLSLSTPPLLNAVYSSSTSPSSLRASTPPETTAIGPPAPKRSASPVIATTKRSTLRTAAVSVETFEDSDKVVALLPEPCSHSAESLEKWKNEDYERFTSPWSKNMFIGPSWTNARRYNLDDSEDMDLLPEEDAPWIFRFLPGSFETNSNPCFIFNDYPEFICPINDIKKDPALIRKSSSPVYKTPGRSSRTIESQGNGTVHMVYDVGFAAPSMDDEQYEISDKRPEIDPQRLFERQIIFDKALKDLQAQQDREDLSQPNFSRFYLHTQGLDAVPFKEKTNIKVIDGLYEMLKTRENEEPNALEAAPQKRQLYEWEDKMIMYMGYQPDWDAFIAPPLDYLWDLKELTVEEPFMNLKRWISLRRYLKHPDKKIHATQTVNLSEKTNHKNEPVGDIVFQSYSRRIVELAEGKETILGPAVVRVVQNSQGVHIFAFGQRELEFFGSEAPPKIRISSKIIPNSRFEVSKTGRLSKYLDAFNIFDSMTGESKSYRLHFGLGKRCMELYSVLEKII